MSLCVFLESREQGRLNAHHPFYRLIEDAIQDAILCPLVLHYMARTAFGLGNAPYIDEVVEKQRVQEIIQYLQNSCPIFSGSDSPALNSTFVDVRASPRLRQRPTKQEGRSEVHVYPETFG
jgi:hypothetical protein